MGNYYVCSLYHILPMTTDTLCYWFINLSHIPMVIIFNMLVKINFMHIAKTYNFHNKDTNIFSKCTAVVLINSYNNN